MSRKSPGHNSPKRAGRGTSKSPSRPLAKRSSSPKRSSALKYTKSSPGQSSSSGKTVMPVFNYRPPKPTTPCDFKFNSYTSIESCLTEILQWIRIPREYLDVYYGQDRYNLNKTERAQINTSMESVFKAIEPHCLACLRYEANCAIFDIDDTIIKSTSPEKKPELVHPYVHHIYTLLLGLGWKIFFITARTDHPDIRAMTEKQLDTLGFVCREELFLMPQENDLGPDESNFSYYKYSVRRKLRELGFVIGLNFGDSYNDHLITPPWTYNDALAFNAARKNNIQEFIFNGYKSFKPLADMNDSVIIFGLEDACVSIKLPQVD